MHKYLLVMIGLLLGMTLHAQQTTTRYKFFVHPKDTMILDSLSIFPGTLKLYCGNSLLSSDQFQVDYASSRVILKNSCDSIVAHYRVLGGNFGRFYFMRDTSTIYTLNKGEREDFMIQPTNDPFELMGASGLKKSGSISRGVAFGNRQDLSVNSSLNLELSGYVAPNLQVLASVTDNNLPIQPEGNTNKLQEFDQVFIQLFNDQFKLTLGDFWISKPEGYFLTYKKRGQGLTGEYYWKKDKSGHIRSQVSGALSKGKFNRQIVQGVEGNQGPYRLRGNENEPFIIVLSGTERVYIDGKLLTRGQEYDYTIDYNTAELTFTAKNLITKDIRIVVEFQYSDQNYARSLFQFATEGTSKKLDWWVNAYSEQDAKNQPLQQNLTDAQKLLLSQVGDRLELARSVVIDSTGFSENLVMYRMLDSLGYDSVLVASVDPNLAVYKVNFTYVGPGKGDYVFQKFNALGRVYKWVAPVAGISQGDHAPVNILITPKQQQLLSLGARYRFTDRIKMEVELARSKLDLNTFSSFDRTDDFGHALHIKVDQERKFGKDSIPKWLWRNAAEVEVLDPYFKPIEQYRAVEYDRDWNTRGQGYTGNQILTQFSTGIRHTQFGGWILSGQQYKIGADFDGYRALLQSNFKANGWVILGDASVLAASDSAQGNTFIRHKFDVSKQWKKLRVGVKDDQEWNQFSMQNGQFSNRSYSFFDIAGYLAIGDTSNGELKLSYRERFDGKTDTNMWVQVAKARTWSLEWLQKSWKNQRLLVVANYRELDVKDSVLLPQKPENTTNGRIDHEIRLWNNVVNLTTFYEAGAGLEQKREFLYIKVNDGQGVYTWIDYNGDGVKDLNEFEIAAFVDQASYIRVFTPSNAYTKTFSNEYNQTLNLRPERVWGSEEGWKGVLARFSTQSRFRIQRKTNELDGLTAYNPFASRLQDSTLISTSSNQKHTLFFNRTNTIFGAEYSYQRVASKIQLATGFDGRFNESHDINARINVRKQWTVQTNFERGIKTSFVDYTTGRNYALSYWNNKNALVFQPNTSLRLSLENRFSYKQNAPEFGTEFARITDFGLAAKFNQAAKGSLQGQVNFIRIQFDGNANSPLGFELLEALKPGDNMVWTFGYQRTLSKNLQLSIQYNGRKSPTTPAIHAGGMEVKAFF